MLNPVVHRVTTGEITTIVLTGQTLKICVDIYRAYKTV